MRTSIRKRVVALASLVHSTDAVSTKLCKSQLKFLWHILEHLTKRRKLKDLQIQHAFRISIYYHLKQSVYGNMDA